MNQDTTRQFLTLAMLALVLPCSSLMALSADNETSNHTGTAVKKPNVVVLLVDDAGLMDFQPFGGEAQMPNLQKLADNGVKFSNYRTSPLCAPSRAMLLTGVDNHRTGVATIPEVLPPEHENQPGYSMHLESGVSTIADHLKADGYRTYMTGKWHLGRRVQDLPISHGFDRSFALDASGADNYEKKAYIAFYDTAPWYEDDKPAELPDDFYSSEFIVDKMIDYIGQDQKDTVKSKQPFFAYLAFQAVHIPIQAPKEFTDKYKDTYTDGWHALREKRWKKAQALGFIPKDAPLAPMADTLRKWDDLTEQERTYYAKAMAVNAGMLDAMDHHIGRLLNWLESTGELDNTIFVVTSDNGPEFNDIVNTPLIDLWYLTSGYHTDIETMGEKRSLVSIGPEWASAAASPSDKFKFVSSEGGVRVPLIISGPNLPKGTTETSFSLVTDITPTLLDLLDLNKSKTQTHTENNVAITGRSLKPVLQGTAERTYQDNDAIGIEVSGNSALFKGQYKIVRNYPPHGDKQWRLFDLSVDPGETSDLSLSKHDVFKTLMEDYSTYQDQYGIQEMPEGFDSMKQVIKNSLKKYASNNWFSILIVNLIIFMLLRMAWLRFKK
jgi:arylsulfatase A-like enzyme